MAKFKCVRCKKEFEQIWLNDIIATIVGMFWKCPYCLETNKIEPTEDIKLVKC
jgi:DNA-directed RNA polymerase subunit RPC12/RpoP